MTLLHANNTMSLLSCSAADNNNRRADPLIQHPPSNNMTEAVRLTVQARYTNMSLQVTPAFNTNIFQPNSDEFSKLFSFNFDVYTCWCYC